MRNLISGRYLVLIVSLAILVALLLPGCSSKETQRAEEKVAKEEVTQKAEVVTSTSKGKTKLQVSDEKIVLHDASSGKKLEITTSDKGTKAVVSDEEENVVLKTEGDDEGTTTFEVTTDEGVTLKGRTSDNEDVKLVGAPSKLDQILRPVLKKYFKNVTLSSYTTLGAPQQQIVSLEYDLNSTMTDQVFYAIINDLKKKGFKISFQSIDEDGYTLVLSSDEWQTVHLGISKGDTELNVQGISNPQTE